MCSARNHLQVGKHSSVVQANGSQHLTFPIAYLPEGNTFTLVIPAYSQEILMLFVLEQQYARLLRLALRTEQHTRAAFELMMLQPAAYKSRHLLFGSTD